MRRVASLYLPFLPTDQIRRASKANATRPESAPAELSVPAMETGKRAEACSCPRDGHWRPGARWARAEAIQDRTDRLPLHQRPKRYELGRRSEPAAAPFDRLNPSFAGSASAQEGHEQPLVTIHRSGQRVVLAAACPDALALGLAPGMALTQARAMVPGLEVHDADPDGDLALLQRVGRFAARRVTPLVALSGTDGLWLDLTGAAHLHGGERRVCAGLLRVCAKLGLSARIAVAGNAAAAHALARHGPRNRLLCPEGEEEAALSPLPIAALRLDGATVNAMRRLGLERIGDLTAMPRGPLARRFGREALLKLDQALGRAAEPFDPIVPRDAPSATLRFAEPIGGAETIARAIAELLDRLVASLGEAGQGARALLLVCERVDRHQQRIEIGAARATRDKAHLLRLLARRIETIDPGFGIDAMHLVAARTEPLGAMAVPGDLAVPEAVPDLALLVDLIAGRLGGRGLYRFSAVESEVPERSVCRVAPLDTPCPWPDKWPRPPRLLPRPEPIEHVIAELPDAPPRRFTWRGKTHRLVKGDGPERVYGEWWKRDGERDAVRDYFRVEDESGARFWLFRRGNGEDPRSGDLSWWVQGGCG